NVRGLYDAVRAGNSRRAHRSSRDACFDDRVWRERARRRRRDRSTSGHRQCSRRCISRYRCNFQRNAADAAPCFGGDGTGGPRKKPPAMKAAIFDYAVPKTVAEASALLASGGAATAAIAGGQSLLPMLNLRVALPDLLVDIGRLQELKEVI